MILEERLIDYSMVFFDYLTLVVFGVFHFAGAYQLHDFFQLIIRECLFKAFLFFWEQLILILIRARLEIILALKKSSMVFLQYHANEFEETQ